MSDSDEIVVLPVVEDDEAYSDDFDAPDKTRPTWPLFLAGGFIVGVGVAIAASWFLRPNPFDDTVLTTRLAQAERELETLKARPEPVIPTIDLSSIEARLEALEARPTVDPLNEEVVARLEALQAEGFELPEIPDLPDMSGFEARLNALETQQQGLATTLAARPSSTVVVDATIDEPVIDPNSLPRFPENILRNGAAERVGGGFVRRTLSRHVRVQGSNNPDILIDGIVKDMSAGQPRAALAKFDRLPPGLQSLARGWRADMDDALK